MYRGLTDRTICTLYINGIQGSAEEYVVIVSKVDPGFNLPLTISS